MTIQTHHKPGAPHDAESDLVAAFTRCNPALSKAAQFLAKWGAMRTEAQHNLRSTCVRAMMVGERDQEGRYRHPIDILREAEATEAPIVESFKIEAREALRNAIDGATLGIDAIRTGGGGRIDANFAPGTHRESIAILNLFKRVESVGERAIMALDDTRQSITPFAEELSRLLGRPAAMTEAETGLFTFYSRLAAIREVAPSSPAPVTMISRAKAADEPPLPTINDDHEAAILRALAKHHPRTRTFTELESEPDTPHRAAISKKCSGLEDRGIVRIGGKPGTSRPVSLTPLGVEVNKRIGAAARA